MTPEQLVEQWMWDQAEYPQHPMGQIAAAAVRCCANELKASLKGENTNGSGLAEDLAENLPPDQAGKILSLMLELDRMVGRE